MGKGLKCADCGREFRGEGRRACSDDILARLLSRACSTSVGGPQWIHESCLAKLRRSVESIDHGQPEVCPSSIHSNYLLCYCINDFHSHPRWALLRLLFVFPFVVLGAAFKETPTRDSGGPREDAQVLGRGGQEDPGEASSSGPRRVRPHESPSLRRVGPFSHIGPCGDLRGAAEAMPAQGCASGGRENSI